MDANGGDKKPDEVTGDKKDSKDSKDADAEMKDDEKGKEEGGLGLGCGRIVYLSPGKGMWVR